MRLFAKKENTFLLQLIVVVVAVVVIVIVVVVEVVSYICTSRALYSNCRLGDSLHDHCRGGIKLFVQRQLP